MIDYVFIIGMLAMCFLWASWRERVNDNKRDSGLLLALSLLSGLGSAGVYVATA